MRFHWGHGIFVFLLIFLLSMAFVIYKSFQQDNPLVEKEYYPKGLEYQKQIDRTRNARALGEKIVITQYEGQLVITYPGFFRKPGISGELYFYRPSGETGDFRTAMAPDTSLVQLISSEKLEPGKYVVKCNWSHDRLEYYDEVVIFVNR